MSKIVLGRIVLYQLKSPLDIPGGVYRFILLESGFASRMNIKELTKTPSRSQKGAGT